MLISDLDAFIVFDIYNAMVINNVTDEEEFINKYSKIRRRKSILVYTGYKSYYFIIPSSKLSYKDVRIKVYADDNLIKYFLIKDNLDLVRNFIKKQNKFIKSLYIRYVNIDRLAISKLTEVKTILRSLDFDNKEYLCEYYNGNESLWYDLYRDGLYLNNEIKYSILNNDNIKKADFNKVTCIQEVKNLYTYELENK